MRANARRGGRAMRHPGRAGGRARRCRSTRCSTAGRRTGCWSSATRMPRSSDPVAALAAARRARSPPSALMIGPEGGFDEAEREALLALAARRAPVARPAHPAGRHGRRRGPGGGPGRARRLALGPSARRYRSAARTVWAGRPRGGPAASLTIDTQPESVFVSVRPIPDPDQDQKFHAWHPSGRRSEPGLRIKTYDPTRPLAFLHVPKTAGAALGAGLARSLGAKRALSGFDRVLFGGFEDFSSVPRTNGGMSTARSATCRPAQTTWQATLGLDFLRRLCPRRNTWS